MFEHLSISVSIVLGLGVTLLLTSMLSSFRRREQVQLDWVPFAWAAYVLVLQGQYWWTMWQLAGTPEWTVLSFGLVLLQAAVMFVAAGLVLPSGSDDYPSNLSDYFEKNGKWGVAALALRGVIAVTGNVVLWSANLLSPAHFLIAGQVATALICVSTQSRQVRVVVTILYGLLLAMTVLAVTPFSYTQTGA